MLDKIEKISETNNICKIDEFELKGILNDRPIIAAVQKVKQIYA